MRNTATTIENSLVSLSLNSMHLHWAIVGEGANAYEKLKMLLQYSDRLSITVIGKHPSDEIKNLCADNARVQLHLNDYDAADNNSINMLVAATGNNVLDEKIGAQAKQHGVMVQVGDDTALSDFILSPRTPLAPANLDVKAIRRNWFQKDSEQTYRRLTSKFILAFLLMVIGHIIISYLPLPSIREIATNIEPYFNYQFLFFVLAGFLAQMVDGVLSMGYGVTSATCLMSFGVNPVAMSAAIHTSEIFTTGISGYSHYKFGNVNKKLFRHLVIPGIIGAVLGALLLVFLGDKYGKWLMPVIALYAGFLGVKILVKAFQLQTKNKKVKRVGWLAWVGGFLDSFGGGGWGPIVTSSLIAKGRSPKYTVGSVSLTEFFVTLSSAFTFFITVGVSHWNIVLGLLIGGGIAAPIAARLAGKLPRKTMMIAVGIMVILWCVRMIIKSL